MGIGIGPWEPLLWLEPGEPGSRRLFLNQSVPDEDKRFEIIGGRFAPKRLGAWASVCANRLLGKLSEHLRPKESGCLIFGVLFDLPAVENFYRPEVAFVPYSTWPRTRRIPDGEAWSVVPELVIEVAEAGDPAAAPVARVADYFRAGVQAVWLLQVADEEIDLHSSPTAVRILTTADELTGDPMIPGFRMPVADLFPPSAANP